jgi:hypothetical protein
MFNCRINGDIVLNNSLLKELMAQEEAWEYTFVGEEGMSSDFYQVLNAVEAL